MPASKKGKKRHHRSCPVCQGDGVIMRSTVIKRRGRKPFNGVRAVPCPAPLLTVTAIDRYIDSRIQKLERAIEREEPFYVTEAAKDEMENLKSWIDKKALE